MSNENAPEKRSRLLDLGEDWLSVLVGLLLVVLAWLGVIGNVPWPLFGFLK